MVVVLPAPLPPRMPVIEPGAIENEMPSTAGDLLVDLGQALDGDGGLVGRRWIMMAIIRNENAPRRGA